MTRDEFYARLAEMTKAGHVTWRDHDALWPAIRLPQRGLTTHCPISFVAGGSYRADTADDAGRSIGLSPDDIRIIKHAADSRFAPERRRIEDACGL